MAEILNFPPLLAGELWNYPPPLGNKFPSPARGGG
jgi:hypothetical protein